MPLAQTKIKEILKNIPHSPGIYKMSDEEGKIIYIGKAKDLSKRVRQYFQKNYEHSTRTKKLLEKTSNLTYTVVDSELEAVILENNLIKQLKPKYNVIMKDDKSFVYIRITKEEFPRIQIVRRPVKDDAKYIGPKTAANKVYETFKILKRVFPFRHCNLDIRIIKKNANEYDVKIERSTIKYPCLDYYIKRCPAPCIGKIKPEDYRKIIKNVENFLEGKGDDIINELNLQMTEFAKLKQFEKAARIRDKINKVREILEKQKISDLSQEDKDIINYCISREKAYFNLFQVRNGKLIGQENFILEAELEDENSSNPEILEAFLKQYYELTKDIPKEILIPHEIENKNEIENFIEKDANKKSKLIVPKIGTKNKLLEMSLNNARIFADRNRPSWRKESEKTLEATEKLREILKLKSQLKRIECYDISHLSGTDTVGSMIVFENGAPEPKMYRKFHLKTVQGKPDDYKSMKEVLLRRFSKIALDHVNQEYFFKKAAKNYKNQIEKHIGKENLKKEIEYKNFYILEKNSKKKKSLAAFASITDHSNKASEINDFFVVPKERGKKIGHKLLKNIINKTKTKRVYLICRQELKEYYLLLGFEEIKKIPEELEKSFSVSSKYNTNPLVLVYDKLKHKPDESFSKIPDLVIIDGGKGQLSIANEVFMELKINIPHIALAKELEEIFLSAKEKSLILPKNNEALKLLQRARDEAHRFAISYNKDLRKKRLFSKE